ncbi:MAG: NAD(P)-binding domain-containing protein, partial [Planctomycetes bacterium]|nr:NAD(P)-binding domain-containing protein [Planctomycetota bacterium]
MSDKNLIDAILARQAVVGIVGLGYVGLPLAIAFANNGFKVIAYDIDADKVEAVNSSSQYIRHIPGEEMRIILDAGGTATADINDLAQADALIICVPTPLTRNREPDMRFVKNISRALAPVLRRGQLVVLESTTYP